MRTHNMKEVVETFIGGILAIAVTLKGLNDFFKEATTVLGFFTTLVGFVTGILILIWWARKVRKQG